MIRERKYQEEIEKLKIDMNFDKEEYELRLKELQDLLKESKVKIANQD